MLSSKIPAWVPLLRLAILTRAFPLTCVIWLQTCSVGTCSGLAGTEGNVLDRSIQSDKRASVTLVPMRSPPVSPISADLI
jgi:hypothetical protein